MATLAQKLPYTHPFAGGYPYRGSARLPSDPDALTYLAAVAAADGAPVEVGVATAVDDFFKGCRADGTFSALKAACLLCGARTLAGALVPLVGAAPTNNNFVDADYNRETGLKGNGSSKYLDSGRANNADPQDDQHIAAYVHTADTGSTGAYIGCAFTTGSTVVGSNPAADELFFRNQSGPAEIYMDSDAVGFLGSSRETGLAYVARFKSSSQQVNVSSQPPSSLRNYVFARDSTAGAISFSDARLAFYSIGTAISDLALLDARVTALVQRIQLSLSTGLDASGYDDATVAYLLAAYNNGATLE
jgi:hypothetical protein